MLRKRQADAEQKLWRYLRDRQLQGLKFRRQFPLPPYVLDFYCAERKLVLELDGGQHIESAQYDLERTAFLQARGFTILRFWNDDVILKTDAVLNRILLEIEKPPHPGPLPAGGEREAPRDFD